MSQQKVLVLDIETSPIKAYVWGLKDQNIGLNQIIEDWHLMAWGAKWLDSSKFIYMDKRKDKTDLYILNEIWKLLNEADIVVTQNGKGFDSRKLNARFMQVGLMPTTPYKHHDTYLIAKSAGDFTSNKLEYLTAKINKKYQKSDHKKYPGMTLWKECLNGNNDAWNEMKKYNKYDVLSTEELYKIIRPWSSKSSAPVFTDLGVCDMCGSNKLERRGIEVLKTAKYQRLHCKECGRWLRGKKVTQIKEGIK